MTSDRAFADEVTKLVGMISMLRPDLVTGRDPAEVRRLAALSLWDVRRARLR